MSERDTLSGFGMGLLAGAAIGMAVGLLYAPKPGRETREELLEKAEAMKEKATQMKEKAAGMVERAKERVSDFRKREEVAA